MFTQVSMASDYLLVLSILWPSNNTIFSISPNLGSFLLWMSNSKPCLPHLLPPMVQHASLHHHLRISWIYPHHMPQQKIRHMRYFVHSRGDCAVPCSTLWGLHCLLSQDVVCTFNLTLLHTRHISFPPSLHGERIRDGSKGV